MSNLSRRDLLKVASAVPALPALRELNSGELQKRQVTGTHLHIIFHGSFIFLEMKSANAATSAIHVLVPKSQLPHYRLAGAWKDEKPLAEGCVYTIEGIQDGSLTASCFRPENDTCLTGFLPLNAGWDKIFCRFVLKWPDGAGPARAATKQAGKPFFYGNHSTYPNRDVSALATVSVLTYKDVDVSNLKFQPHHDWNPMDDKQGNTIHLHVFCDTDHAVNDLHAKHVMAEMAGVFPDLNLGMNFALDADKRFAVPELSETHLLSLRERDVAPAHSGKMGAITDKTCGRLAVQFKW